MKRFQILAFLLIILVQNASSQKMQSYLSVPGYNEYAKIDTIGNSILPSGRYVTPVGKSIRITNDPYGLKISPDGTVAISMHENAITLINLKNYQTKRIPEYRHNEESPLKKGSFLGIAFHPTKKIVYLSGGDEGTVIIYDFENSKKIDSIKLDGVFDNKQFNGSFTSDLTYLQASNDLLIKTSTTAS